MRMFKTFTEFFRIKICLDEFKTKITKLTLEEYGNFLRASLNLQDSQTCKDCGRIKNKDGIAMVLLCSSIEAMNPKSKQILFKDWLIKECLENLEMKSKSDVEKAINKVYAEFLKLPEREGAFHNFKHFLLDNCPKYLSKSVPMETVRIPKREKSRQATFEEVLKCIYDKFRSLYLHKAKSYASYDKGFHGVTQWVSIGNIEYTIYLSKLLPWFSDVVKESLYNYLIMPRKLQK